MDIKIRVYNLGGVLIRVKSKDSRLGLLVGFGLGFIAVLIFIFLYFDMLYARFPAEEKEDSSVYSVIISTRDIASGEIISEDDFSVVETSTYKYSGISEEYLLGKKAGIDIAKNIPLTYEMFSEEKLEENEARLYEVDFVSLMSNISVGDVVDIRISLPNGDDFTVLAAKEIKSLNTTESEEKTYLSLELKEKEILILASAYNDYKLLDGVKIYTAKYVDRNRQDNAVVNYPVNDFVASLIEGNLDIKDKTLASKRELIEKCYDKQLEVKETLADEDEFDLLDEEFYDGEFEDNDLEF